MSLNLESIHNFKGKFPKQIWSLFFSEMWERFCFYGMRGMLVFFMIHQLDFKEAEANSQYAATQAFVYAFTFVGGLIADKILGFRKSLFWGGLLMVVGSTVLAVDPHRFFFIGISFIIVGTGFFKPNISSMVGKLYKKNDVRRDAGFSLFYAGINLGALLGGYICVAIGKGFMFSSFIPESSRWNVAFGLASMGMVMSLVNFYFAQNSLGPIGLSPEGKHRVSSGGNRLRKQDLYVYIGTFAAVPVIRMMVSETQYTDYFMFTIGPFTLLYFFWEMSKVNRSARKKLLAALVFMFFSIFFWGIFEQSGGSMSIFADKNLSHYLLGVKLDPNGVNNSGGALFIILLAPIFGLLWIWLNKRKWEPDAAVKFGIGFIFLGLGFCVLFATRFFSENGIASLEIFTLSLLVITLGELCLSPIGLSVMTKLATEKLQGIMMGMWFLSSAYGQYVAGIIGERIASVGEGATPEVRLITYTEGYKILGMYALAAGILLVSVSPWIKKLMQGVR
ncbi:MAG: peptide MFS transporter [Bergeyella sp.]|nr:peptide MFS transporter [Bergeyella sp.]